MVILYRKYDIELVDENESLKLVTLEENDILKVIYIKVLTPLSLIVRHYDELKS